MSERTAAEETTREQAWIEAAAKVVRLDALGYTNATAATDLMALADSEVATAVLECRRDQQERIEALAKEIERMDIPQDTSDFARGWNARGSDIPSELRAALAGEVNPE